MDRDTLQLFLDIRDTGNITRAANANYITQSTASKRIAQLEKELGVELFCRGKGKSTAIMTPAGEGFSDIAERMLLLYQQAMALKEDADRGLLTIACVNSVQGYTLPPLIRTFQEKHPHLCVTLEDHHSVEIFPLLLNRRVDVGITQTAAPFPELTSELLFEEPYRVVMLSGRRSANDLEEIHPASLLAEHEIFEAFDTDLQIWHDYWWKPSAAKIRVNTTPTAERYFYSPEDWMIVPETVARMMEGEKFISVPLAENPPKHHVFTAYHKNNENKVVQDIVKVMKQYFTSDEFK